MSQEKRSYVRVAPLHWSVSKGRSLWDKGVPVKKIAEACGVSEMTIKRAARRYGWRVRKMWSPKIEKPLTVRRRCPKCAGHYETGRDWTPHPECTGGSMSIYLEAA